MAYLEHHETDKALEVVEEARQLWPNSPLLRRQLAAIRFSQGNNEAAAAILQEVVADRPDYTEARMDLADYLNNTGRPAEALELLEQGHDPRDLELPAVQLCRGRFFLAQGKQSAALQACERAMKLAGGDVRMVPSAADLLLRLGQLDRAIKVLNRAVHRVPTNAALRANLALALRWKGHTEEAAAQAEEALRLDAKNAFAHSERGQWLFRQRQYGAAQAAFREAVALEPANVGWRVNLSMALRWTGRYEDAAAEAEEALRRNSKYALAHNERGLC